MSAVEIKQTLEREFDLFMTAQDLRSMTFKKLKEMEDMEDKSVAIQSTGNTFHFLIS